MEFMRVVYISHLPKKSQKGCRNRLFLCFFIVTVTFSLQCIVSECVSMVTLKVLIVTHRHLCFLYSSFLQMLCFQTRKLSIYVQELSFCIPLLSNQKRVMVSYRFMASPMMVSNFILICRLRSNTAIFF